jgi:hypothetical protein
MRQLWFLCALFLVAALGGCGSPEGKLESKASECQKAFNEMPKERIFYAEPMKYWVKNKQFVTKVDFDVTKTDSLVTPFIGRIDVAQFYGVVTSATKEAVAELPVVDFSDGITHSVRLSFVFKDGAWIEKGSRSKYEKGPKPIFTADSSDAIEFEANIFRDDPQLSKCLF